MASPNASASSGANAGAKPSTNSSNSVSSRANLDILHDADIRESLFEWLELRHGKARIIEEKDIGRSRCDAFMVTEDKITGIEIKSDADTYARLASQTKDYDRYFDANMVVVGSTHSRVAEHVPEWWGIVAVKKLDDGTGSAGSGSSCEDNGSSGNAGAGNEDTSDGDDATEANAAANSADSAPSDRAGQSYPTTFHGSGYGNIDLNIEIIRECKPNPKMNRKLKLGILWHPELAHILRVNDLPRYEAKSKKFVVDKIIEKVDPQLLDRQICDELFERDYTTIAADIAAYRREKRADARGAGSRSRANGHSSTGKSNHSNTRKPGSNRKR